MNPSLCCSKSRDTGTQPRLRCDFLSLLNNLLFAQTIYNQLTDACFKQQDWLMLQKKPQIACDTGNKDHIS